MIEAIIILARCDASQLMGCVDAEIAAYHEAILPDYIIE